MAKLDARMDDFIRLVLDVSGRVRPSDIQGVDPNEAAELLRQYRSEHPESRLVLSGDTLTPDLGAPVSSPAPVAPAYSAPAPQPVAQQDQWPSAMQAGNDYGAPQPVYPDSSGDYSVPPAPQPVPGQGFGGPGYAAPAPAAQDAYGGQQPYTEHVPPASDWQGSAEPYPDESAAAGAPSESRVAWYWWLLPLLFTWLGGLIAWLALRDRQPRAAKRLLIFGLVMTVVMIVIAALLIALGFAAFLVPVTASGVVESSLTTVTPTP